MARRAPTPPTAGPRLVTEPPPAPRRRRRPELPIVLAVALGIAVRAVHVAGAPFPLNDGGFFVAMVQALRAAGYHLPAVVHYDGLALPYAYSPFGFYAAAAAVDLFGLTPIGALRLLPLVGSALSVVAFALLARRLLASRLQAAFAVLAFGLAPRSFIWMIMGGGLTRSFGFAFALLALWLAHRLFRERGWWPLPLAAAAAALSVLSHLGTAPWLAMSLALFWVWYGRTRRSLLAAAALALLTTLLTAPWWLAVVRLHGWAPFLAARASGESVFTTPWLRIPTLVDLASFELHRTGESLFPVIGVLAVVGALVALPARRLAFPVWWVLTLLVDAREGASFATVPIALLAAIGICEGMLPLLRRAARRAARGDDVAALGPVRWFPGAVGLAALCYVTMGALMTDPRWAGEGTALVALDGRDRAAMAWVAAHAPPASRFAVVSGLPWHLDRYGEWFPVLAERVSVGTVQGSEWLAAGEFAKRRSEQTRLQGCRDAGAACLDGWSAATGRPITQVYLPKTLPYDCCTELATSLAHDAAWTRIYDGPGATIFERRGKP